MTETNRQGTANQKHLLLLDLFTTLVVVVTAVYGSESIWTGAVSRFVTPYYFFVPASVTALFLVFVGYNASEKTSRRLFFLVIGSGAIILFSTANLSVVGRLVAAASFIGLMVMLVGAPSDRAATSS